MTAAFSVTALPSVKLALQVAPQLMPAGLLVTVPLPAPIRLTLSVRLIGSAGQFSDQIRLTAAAPPRDSGHVRVALTAAACRVQLGSASVSAVLLVPTKLSCAMLVVGNAAPPLLIVQAPTVVVAAAPLPDPPLGAAIIPLAVPTLL